MKCCLSLSIQTSWHIEIYWDLPIDIDIYSGWSCLTVFKHITFVPVKTLLEAWFPLAVSRVLGAVPGVSGGSRASCQEESSQEYSAQEEGPEEEVGGVESYVVSPPAGEDGPLLPVLLVVGLELGGPGPGQSHHKEEEIMFVHRSGRSGGKWWLSRCGMWSHCKTATFLRAGQEWASSWIRRRFFTRCADSRRGAGKWLYVVVGRGGVVGFTTTTGGYSTLYISYSHDRARGVYFNRTWTLALLWYLHCDPFCSENISVCLVKCPLSSAV